jgi:hypothetical protein
VLELPVLLVLVCLPALLGLLPPPGSRAHRVDMDEAEASV